MVPNAANVGAYPAAMDAAGDLRVRLAAFEWLRERVELHGDVLPRPLLAQGFVFEGQRVPLLGPQGIFKPRVCELPLSITTIPDGPYADRMDGSHLRYSYRGTDVRHPDNVGLRRAMERRVPLILFVRLDPGRYMAQCPVFIVGDNSEGLLFDVDVESRIQILTEDPAVAASDADPIERRYVTSAFRRRVHQRRFRERVLDAYRVQCAICRLHHQELLDAAHIVGDSEDEGDPVVSNGLALCKLHHAAFDSFFLAVRPDYTIEVRRSILEESDGPMLLVGLKQTHDQTIQLPRSRADRPDPARLQSRYERFLRVS
jgi:putative restriction endonuclease